MKVYMLAVAVAGLMLAAGGTLALAEAQAVETPPDGPAIPGGSMQGKAPTAPAASAMTAWLMRNTPRRGEWVNIPVGKVQLHTWISYPDGNDPHPVVIVMNSYAGMWDDFPRGMADQLAQDGFIGVAPDFVSGMGPNGGNWDSFPSVDLAIKAAQRVGVLDAIAMVKAIRDHALKLPRANGKSATVGTRFGGNVSFAAAALIPGLNAAVVYDGTAAPDAATMAKITAPVLYFGGALDDRAVAMVEPTSAAMKKLGKSFEYHIWSATTGEFVTFGIPGNNTKADLASWPLVLTFLQAHTK